MYNSDFVYSVEVRVQFKSSIRLPSFRSPQSSVRAFVDHFFNRLNKNILKNSEGSAEAEDIPAVHSEVDALEGELVVLQVLK